MNQQNMNFFRRFLNSIINFNSYAYFIRQTAGKAVLYLFLVSLFFGIVITIRPVVFINTELPSILDRIAEEIPDFTLENGILDIQGEMPLMLGSESYPIIIDTTGKSDESALDEYASGVFISATEMVQKSPETFHVTPFKDIRTFRITKETLLDMLPLIRVMGIVVAFLLALFFIVVRFLSAVILSIAGLFAANIKGLRLRFRDVFKLSAYALTLPTLLAVLLMMTGLQLKYFNLIYLSIGFLYIWNGLGIIRREIDKQLNSGDTQGQQ